MSALAGGDSIDDTVALRAGGTGRVVGFTVKAASTLGTAQSSVVAHLPPSARRSFALVTEQMLAMARILSLVSGPS
jgi:hypothetical protein